MASYHLQVKSVRRSEGRSTTAAAAYRHAERIECQREGRTHDYSRKQGVEDGFIVAPEDAPAWAQDREALWNAAEARETRVNSVTAREWELALPAELDHRAGRREREGKALSLKPPFTGRRDAGPGHARTGTAIMETMDDFLKAQAPTAQRPLGGLTVLVVEDSRFASEGFRLLCLRSGGRIRRADSLQAAERHLRTYRPGALLVDMGLPDGSGAELIARLGAAQPRIDVILALSGDPGAHAPALAAGADGFLLKPVLGLGAFQAAILAHLPPERQPKGPRAVSGESVIPDPLAYRDDLSHAARVLAAEGAPRVEYVTQFLGGLALSVGDGPMSAAVEAVRASRGQGDGARSEVARLAAMVQARLAIQATVQPRGLRAAREDAVGANSTRDAC